MVLKKLQNCIVQGTCYLHTVILNFDLRAEEKITVEEFAVVPQKLQVLCKCMPLLNSASSSTLTKLASNLSF